MKTYPLKSVDCELLHNDYKTLGSLQIQAEIRSGVEAAGLEPEACKLTHAGSKSEVCMTCGDLQVIVKQCVPVKDADHLFEAIRLHASQSLFASARQLISNCHYVTTVSVQKAASQATVHKSSNTSSVASHPNPFSRARETEQAMLIARTVAVGLLSKCRAEAVYWAQSLYLTTPENFERLANSADEILLYVRPHIQAEREAVKESGKLPLLGVTGYGSEYLIGYRVRFEPSRLPANYMAENILKLVALCWRQGTLVRNGDVFGRSEIERIGVTFQKNGDMGPNEIVLRVLANAGLGIANAEGAALNKRPNGASVTSLSPADVDSRDLDASDPVDAAILERLAELREATPAPDAMGPAAEIYTPPPDALMPSEDSSPSTVAELNLSGLPVPISKLRTIALHAQSRQEHERTRRGFLSRLFGRQTPAKAERENTETGSKQAGETKSDSAKSSSAEASETKASDTEPSITRTNA